MGTWSTSEPTLPSDSPAYSGGQDFGYHQTSYAVIHAWGYIRRAEGKNVVIKLDILTDSGGSGYSRGYFYLKAGNEEAETTIRMPNSQYTSHTYVYWKGELNEDATISITAGINAAASTQTTKQFTGPALITYSVTYSGNGNTGGYTSGQTKINGENLVLENCGFVKTGYVFVCWNTKPDGSGQNYTAGATYTANAALTLYAIWKKANIPLYVNPDGEHIYQVEKAYVNVPNVGIKECKVYTRIGNNIILLS